MTQSLQKILLASLLAIILVVAAILAITRLTRGDSSLLRNVSLSETTLSPNADGDNDVLKIAYEISRDAHVSIYFEDAAGKRFYFRESKTRGAGKYNVAFSGIVEGYLLPDEQINNEVEARLLQNGHYQWGIEAVEISPSSNGVTESKLGNLQITDTDAKLPLIAGFEHDRDIFTPNRDGINDRVKIQFDLKKDAENVRVFLLDADGTELEIQALPGTRPARTESVARFVAGRHVYDYEGGVDFNARPPADGTYELIVFAEDAEGQKVRTRSSLTIELGGVPRAEIPAPVSGDTVQFSLSSEGVWQLCDTLYFTATVGNYGEVPIRTTGPEPGLVYDSDWNYNRIGWGTESGAFRFAIGYEDEIRNYGYRWAIGSHEELTKIGEHYYLMPGQQVIISGGIRLTDQIGARLHQPMWAGLIHEDVAIAQLNDRVGRTGINIEYPTEDQWIECEQREVPLREDG